MFIRKNRNSTSFLGDIAQNWYVTDFKQEFCCKISSKNVQLEVLSFNFSQPRCFGAILLQNVLLGNTIQNNLQFQDKQDRSQASHIYLLNSDQIELLASNLHNILSLKESAEKIGTFQKEVKHFNITVEAENGPSTLNNPI